jgi:hypothetical protein
MREEIEIIMDVEAFEPRPRHRHHHHHPHRPRRKAAILIFTTGTPAPFTLEAPMALETLLDTQQVDVTISFFDADQPIPNPAAVTPSISVDDSTILALAQPPLDGPVTSVTVTVASTGKIGSANLLCTATNADGTTISGSQAFHVVSGDAASMTFDLGTPVAIPATPAPTA